MGEREILRNLHLPVGHRGQHLILFKSLRCSGVASEIFGSCFHHDPRRHKCHKRPPSTAIHRHPGTQKFLTAQKVLRVDRSYTSLGALDWYESRLAYPDWAATGAAGFEFDLGYVQHGGFTTYLWHFLVGTVMANHTHVQILTHVLAPFFLSVRWILQGQVWRLQDFRIFAVPTPVAPQKTSQKSDYI